LLAHVTAHQLEAWEPRLCVTLYALLLQCAHEGALSSGAGEAELYARLYRLDPAEAVRHREK
jgi:hypothetical protein